MVARNLQRRSVLGGMAASTLLARVGRADDVVDLQWEDLLPDGASPVIPNALQGLFEHDESAPLFSQQPASSGVRSDWNGQVVRLPGFIVPIDLKGTSVEAFLLVPYVGACVHVPPPPANQLVFVTTPTPYDIRGMFEAVHVTGMFGVSSLSTHLADVGYALSADVVEPYRA